MFGRVLRRSSVVALTVLLFVVYSALMIGFEIGLAVGLHIVKNVWLDVVGGMAMFVVPALSYTMMLAVEEDTPEAGFFGGVVVTLAGLVVGAQLYQGLDERVLHEHGRQVQAVVSRVYWQSDGTDGSTRMADFTDLSGQPVPGELSEAGGLKVGQQVTLTVDPAGKVPMALGTPPTGDGAFHTVKIACGVEALALLWPAYRGAVVFLRVKRPPKAQDLQDLQDLQDSPDSPDRPEPVEPPAGSVSAATSDG